MISSRVSGFYRWSLGERARWVARWGGPSDGVAAERVNILCGPNGLDLTRADQMVENVIGLHGLPLGVALNFVINGRDVLVPMAVEEPSVIAGASFAARLVREGGGFQTDSSDSEMIGQIQVIDVVDVWSARFKLLSAREELLQCANECDPVIVGLGGGARDLEVRVLEGTPIGAMLVVHLVFDCLDAMGANTVNTVCEALAPRIEEMTGGRVGLRILSNLADRRLARARCMIPVEALDTDDFAGEQVARGIVEAWALASVDPYRAATHNKGIMNGVDAVVVATGNDWRAIEAGAHAYAAQSGRYCSLSAWERDNQGNLIGTLEMPMAVGIVGGATRVHPVAGLAVELLGVQSARELAEVIVAVGLAQNLAALRALATEGIQRGHMRLHARQVALAVGAAEHEVASVVERMIAEGHVRPDRAEAILAEHRREVNPGSHQRGQ